MTRLARLAMLPALAAGSLWLAPAVSAGDPCFRDLTRPPATTAAETAIGIADCTFGPTVNYVEPGARVVWHNKSGQPHEIVGANLAWGAHDKLIEPGDTVAWTFDEPGVFPYSCMIHPGMTGAIVVGQPMGLTRTSGVASDGSASTVETSSGGASEAAPSSAAVEGTSAALAIGGGIALLAAIGVVGIGLARRRQRITG